MKKVKERLVKPSRAILRLRCLHHVYGKHVLVAVGGLAYCTSCKVYLLDDVGESGAYEEDMYAYAYGCIGEHPPNGCTAVQKAAWRRQKHLACHIHNSYALFKHELMGTPL